MWPKTSCNQFILTDGSCIYENQFAGMTVPDCAEGLHNMCCMCIYIDDSNGGDEEDGLHRIPRSFLQLVVSLVSVSAKACLGGE